MPPLGEKIEILKPSWVERGYYFRRCPPTHTHPKNRLSLKFHLQAPRLQQTVVATRPREAQNDVFKKSPRFPRENFSFIRRQARTICGYPTLILLQIHWFLWVAANLAQNFQSQEGPNENNCRWRPDLVPMGGPSPPKGGPGGGGALPKNLFD